MGHTEGITYVSAKVSLEIGFSVIDNLILPSQGDGRYVISNGKDQAMRLWDLRNMRNNAEFETFQHKRYGQKGFDYRLVYLILVAVVFHHNLCAKYQTWYLWQAAERCSSKRLQCDGVSRPSSLQDPHPLSLQSNRDHRCKLLIHRLFRR